MMDTCQWFWQRRRATGFAFSKSRWWLAMLAIGLAKVWAVAGDEVLVSENDASSYIWTAAGLVWGRAGDFLPSHPIGFPLIAGLVAQFGVPWRLALEVLYLGACGGLAIVVAGLAGSRLVAILLFTVMAWHPWTFTGFHDFMPDPFVLVVSVALFALMLKLLGHASAQWRWRVFLAMGGLLFLWDWSRYEGPLVYGGYGLFAVLAWFLSRAESNPAPWRRRLALLAAPILMLLVLGSMAQWANYYHFGIKAKAQIGEPGLMALLKALYRIKPERPLRYAPVTRQSLEAACQASPTLKVYEKALLDPQASATRFGEKVTQAPGEFGSWLNWLLTHSLPGDPRLANDIMLKAASEINAALRDGRLPSRRAFFPIDPNWELWLPDLLPCTGQALREGTSLQPWTTGPIPSQSAWLEVVFDQTASRRNIRASSQVLVGEGTVQAAPGALDSVVITDETGKFLSAAPLSSNSVDQAQSFRLRLPWREGAQAFGLEFFQQGQRRLTQHGQFDAVSPWSAQQPPTPVLLPDTGEKIVCSYNFFSIGAEPKVLRFQKWERNATLMCKPLIWAALLLSAALLFFGRPWGNDRLRQVWACLLLVAGWFLARGAFYGFLKATVAWSAERYMRCMSPLFILLLILTVAIIAALLQKPGRRLFGMGTAGA